MKKLFVSLICFSLLALLVGCDSSSISGNSGFDPSPGNTSPTTKITSPTDGASYAIGDEITFLGTGTDTEDGDLTNTALVWTSDIDGEIGISKTFDFDGLSAGAHQITLAATDFDGAEAIDTVVITVVGNLPDTGQTTSYTGTFGEDSDYEIYTDTFGEDSDYEINPQSYTKLDVSGKDLDDSETDWVMVRDNVTGLIWEVKADDDGIHDRDDTYTWQDAQDAFIAQLNSEIYGGYSDWRLPTKKEIHGLIESEDYGAYTAMINPVYFPQTNYFTYWSSSTCAFDTASAWGEDFGTGIDVFTTKTYGGNYVRAVRGEPKDNDGFIDNGDRTVTDTLTGLMWQQVDTGAFTWEEALAYCENLELAGYDDWRLPNRNELQSIVDCEKYDPSIDTVFFPGTVSSEYWTSTTYAHAASNAYYLDFNYGNLEADIDAGYKTDSYNVRAVRGGTSGSSGANPAIISLTAKRIGSDVIWTATVSDDDTLDAITYLWSFDGGLTFSDDTANPATMENYSTFAAGNLTLTVTDGYGMGGSTSITYTVPVVKFPIDEPPLLFIPVSGQSNAGAGGSTGVLYSETPYPYQCMQFDKKTAYGTSIIDESLFTLLQPATDAGSAGQYPATLASLAYENFTRENKGIASSGMISYTPWQGSEPIGSFLRGTNNWENLMIGARKSIEISDKYKRDVECKFYTFIQGESGPAEYYSELVDYADDVRQELKFQMNQDYEPEMVILQINSSDIATKASGVEQDQFEAAYENTGITLAGPMYDAPFGESDDIHQSPIGRMIIGERLAECYRTIMAGEKFTPLWPEFVSIDKNIIEIVFNVPGENLNIDTDWVPPVPNYGFVFSDSENSAHITDVIVLNDTTVRIILNQIPTGDDRKIEYAVQNDLSDDSWANGRGQLYTNSSTKSFYHAQGFEVPEFVRHYAVRFTFDLN